jgi:hypothetical protein
VSVDRQPSAELSAEISAEIDRCIEAYLTGDDERLEWVRAAVRQHRFLPVYLGWVAVLGLRPDGSVVRWNHDEGDEGPVREIDPFWIRLTLHHAGRDHPRLAALIPPRPPGATDCRACGGSGDVAGLPEMVCECGGLGWRLGAPGSPGPG